MWVFVQNEVVRGICFFIVSSTMEFALFLNVIIVNVGVIIVN